MTHDGLVDMPRASGHVVVRGGGQQLVDLRPQRALDCFDGVLNANTEALARLAPAALADIEELDYRAK